MSVEAEKRKKPAKKAEGNPYKELYLKKRLIYRIDSRISREILDIFGDNFFFNSTYTRVIQK
jgi:hypothetical protein